MRNLVFGAIGVVWGLGILIFSLVRGGPQGEGAYAAGQMVGLLFGVLLLGVGGYYLFDGIRTVRAESEKPKKRKRPRRPVEEEVEE
jgi:hypothetical protein